MRVALSIGMYAALAGLTWIFTSTQVAPCLGGPAVDNTPCVERWLADRPFGSWLLSTPYLELAGFLAATALTIWWSRRSRRLAPPR